jgi:hypothetical protein
VSDLDIWEAVWEREKERVGRASHDAWLAWVGAASPLGHVPEPRGQAACGHCGESSIQHRPTTPGPQLMAYFQPACTSWELLTDDQRDAIINAVGGRERFRLGYLAADRENKRLGEVAGRFLACTNTSECQVDDDDGSTCFMGCKAEVDLKAALAAGTREPGQ